MFILLFAMSLDSKLTTEQKFLKAYDDNAKALWRYAYFRVSEQELAEDLVSETFMRAWDKYRENPLEQLRPLLYRILHNLIIDYYRRHKEIKSLEDAPEVSDNHLPRLQASLELSELRELLAKLPENYQQILIWRYVNDLDIYEIAQILGKTQAGIYVTIHRALKILRRLKEESNHVK